VFCTQARGRKKAKLFETRRRSLQGRTTDQLRSKDLKRQFNNQRTGSNAAKRRTSEGECKAASSLDLGNCRASKAARGKKNGAYATHRRAQRDSFLQKSQGRREVNWGGEKWYPKKRRKNVSGRSYHPQLLGPTDFGERGEHPALAARKVIGGERVHEKEAHGKEGATEGRELFRKTCTENKSSGE